MQNKMENYSQVFFGYKVATANTLFRTMNGQKVEGRLFSMERGKGGAASVRVSEESKGDFLVNFLQ